MNKTHKLDWARLLSGLIFLILIITPLQAKTTCQRTFQGDLCISEVDFKKFAKSYAPQKMSQWCWAACISMVFGYNNHPVSQERIVQEAYGGIVNMPSGNGFNLARQLNRNWVDDKGKKFSAQLSAVYDFDARVFNFNNIWVINELDAERPFINGSGTHATVVTAVQYYRTPNGPIVTSVGVFDPWPGVGPRGLTPAEMTPMSVPSGTFRFAASAVISDL